MILRPNLRLLLLCIKTPSDQISRNLQGFRYELKLPNQFEIWQAPRQPLQWRHNERDGVSNHQPDDCLLNRLFGRRSKKTSKLRVTNLCAGNSPVTGEFPAQRASNVENVSISWRHHGSTADRHLTDQGGKLILISSLVVSSPCDQNFCQFWNPYPWSGLTMVKCVLYGKTKLLLLSWIQTAYMRITRLCLILHYIHRLLKRNYIFTFYVTNVVEKSMHLLVISYHYKRFETGYWNSSSKKARVYPFCIVKIIAEDARWTPRTEPSPGMVLGLRDAVYSAVTIVRLKFLIYHSSTTADYFCWFTAEKSSN